MQLEKLQLITCQRNVTIENTELIGENICSAEIVEYYNSKIDTIHLCGKCRKEFEGFLKMKKLSEMSKEKIEEIANE